MFKFTMGIRQSRCSWYSFGPTGILVHLACSTSIFTPLILNLAKLASEISRQSLTSRIIKKGQYSPTNFTAELDTRQQPLIPRCDSLGHDLATTRIQLSLTP